MVTQDLVGYKIGDYEILEIYGKGGMGTVYRARQLGLDRQVAFKVMNIDASSKPELAERFRHEARTSAKLEHPNIVPIYAHDTFGDVAYVSMRLLTGGTLDERRKQHTTGRLTLTEADQLLKQLASALQYAHDRDVIHRDIKGDNVLFDEMGTPYLVDFGLAKILGELSNRTLSGAVLGTPSHMAPEQWLSESDDLTPAADQYALGVVLYEILSGAPPFKSDTPGGYALKHTNHIAPFLHTLVDGIPEQTSRVIAKALSKAPADRYETVTAFANAFSESIQSIDPHTSGFFTLKVTRDNPVSQSLGQAPTYDDVNIYQHTITPQISRSGKSSSTVPDGRTQALSPSEVGRRRNYYIGWIVGGVALALALTFAVFVFGLNPVPDNTLRPLRDDVFGREEAFAESAAVATLVLNQAYDISGVSPDDNWYRVTLPDGSQVWVTASQTYVRARVLEDAVPVVVTDTPTPLPTHTPTATPLPVTAVADAAAAPEIPPLVNQFATRANWVTELAFSPNGEEILSASTDGRLRLWDPDPVRLLGEMNGGGNSVLDVAFNPNGFTAASAYLDGSVQVWLLGGNNTRLSKLEGHEGEVFAVDYSPNGEQLASGGMDGTVRLWDLNSAPEEAEINQMSEHEGAVLDVAFSPDGTRVASAGVDGTVRLWNPQTNESTVLDGHTDAVWSVQFSPDGESLATGSEDSTVRLWTAQGAEIDVIYGHERAVYTVAFSADGTLVASAGEDPVIQIWDFLTGERLTDILRPEDAIFTVVFSPNNQDIAFGGKEGSWGVAKIINEAN